MDGAKEVEEAKVEAERPAQARVAWRNLFINDIESLARVADKIHPDLTESDEVFAERVKLFPSGCLALVEGDSNELCGYAISHPIRQQLPPALNSLLRELAPDADQYFIHDLAILPQFRGQGLAQECIVKLFAIAKQFPTTSLVSVYGTSPFWARFGFLPVEINGALEKKLLDYGDDAIYLERKNDKN
ncbi:MAG: hypothetical protein Q9227_003897 [Pyrenula ochraceoflavens]